ncbi:MAG TPA: hypothetical protein VEH86_05325 [Candidatus Acidoferrum sp.]|nr:hypothetical protein [Candidatus Acidoferrum sp.]
MPARSDILKVYISIGEKLGMDSLLAGNVEDIACPLLYLMAAIMRMWHF